jgi:hypothetical protein
MPTAELDQDRHIARLIEERDELVNKIEELGLALAQAVRDRESWEDWGNGWKARAEANEVEREKSWRELEMARVREAALRKLARRWVPDRTVDVVMEEAEVRHVADQGR